MGKRASAKIRIEVAVISDEKFRERADSTKSLIAESAMPNVSHLATRIVWGRESLKEPSAFGARR